MAPAMPTSKLLMPRPVFGSASASDIDPTIVTSSPSRIHTVPRPITTSQWNLDQGSRSSRAGMSVVIRPVSTPMIEGVPPYHRTKPQILLLAVVPEAASGLPTEVSGGHQVLQERGRGESGF